MGKHSRFSIVLVCGFLVIGGFGLVACGGKANTPQMTAEESAKATTVAQTVQAGANAIETDNARIIKEQTATYLAGLPTATLPPTKTPEPTQTPKFTDTPEPTDTPPATPTPLPKPIILKGRGDDVVDLAKWSGPAIAKIQHSGKRNFAVWNYGAAGEQIDLLVNTIGNYSGTLPIDFGSDENTTRFKVNADGAWQIELAPLAAMRQVTIPGKFSGNGDDVIYLDGKNPDKLTASAGEGAGNFAVYSYSPTERDLLINEIAPYSGTVLLTKDAFILVIGANGPWNMEITTK